jgi:hypothetical protein
VVTLRHQFPRLLLWRHDAVHLLIGATILRYYGLLKQAFAAKPAPLRDP